MILGFIIALFGTLLITRIGAHKFHDMINYDKLNPKNSQAKTPTGWLRRKTGFDWHHIHIGFILLTLAIFLIIFQKFNNSNVILLGIGLSMIIDQITPLINRKRNYFSKKMLINSILLHIIITMVALMIFYI